MGSFRHLGFCTYLGLIAVAGTAEAKEYGVQSPSGRKVYKNGETFGAAVSQDQRRFVVEVATGAGPEGNLSMLIGWLPQQLNGLEFYAGYGIEVNPAAHYTLSSRLFFRIGEARPYIGIGYLFNELPELGTFSHNIFGEIGHRWKIHKTYRLTLGAGVRRILHIGVHDDSVLAEPDVDPDLLRREIDGTARWVPTIAIRFSRAF